MLFSDIENCRAQLSSSLIAMDLAKGDFTVEKIETKSRDELGLMSGSLNEMYESNRDVISRISSGSANVNDSSEKMNKVASYAPNMVKEY